jgi:hypothetical protein
VEVDAQLVEQTLAGMKGIRLVTPPPDHHGDDSFWTWDRKINEILVAPLSEFAPDPNKCYYSIVLFSSESQQVPKIPNAETVYLVYDSDPDLLHNAIRKHLLKEARENDWGCCHHVFYLSDHPYSNVTATELKKMGIWCFGRESF